MNVRERIRAIIADRILIVDGAIGTLLQMRGLEPGMPPEVLLLDAPKDVTDVHRLYVEAGADIITTNSFGASRLKLAQHGLEDRFEQINRLSVETARKAANGRALVAGSIGPTGELLQPMGSISMIELQEEFRRQARILKQAGADLAIIETMGDLGELQAAARACYLERFPFMTSMTFNEAGRSLSGSTPENLAITMAPFHPLAIGTNCGMGPAGMVPRIHELVSVTDCPILAQPNAGLPELVGSTTVFRLPPEPFAERAVKLADAGASIIGGCCGTTPDHILALRNSLKDRRPAPAAHRFGVRFSARSGIALAGEGAPFCVIGERINPTGRKILSRQLRTGDFSMLRKDAGLQVERGASLLDVNVGVPDADESDLMIRAIHELQSLMPAVPLSIDSNDPDTLTAGLHNVVGIALLNSINGEQSRLDKLLPIVAETGANFIALAMDETGMPEDAATRMNIIRRIIDSAEKFGIARNRILVDCLVFTVASQPQQAKETLEAIRRVKSELGCATSLGVSNVSFGLPARDSISSTFLAMAITAGLDAGIINPLSDRMMETLRSTELLMNRDSGARQYLSFIEKKEKRDREHQKTMTPVRQEIIESPVKTVTESKAVTDSGREIRWKVLEGDRTGIVSAIDDQLSSGKSPDTLLSGVLVPAIQDVGRRYGNGEIYLPQLILAGETMRIGVEYLRPMLAHGAGAGLHNTPLVIGTVEGDIHDIGKNIVAIVLENQGFRIIDLGKNVSVETFARAIRDSDASVVALSALMTTTMLAMESTVKILKDRCPGVKIMVGGAVVTQSFADRIGADGYAKEAVGAGNMARRLAGLSLL
ncbi:homocysteine S-methyltransferase family protein [bacterium]|nr:homocysteine S-methyltransferase family protein [candidate division CSSED10-310 bacterium]